MKFVLAVDGGNSKTIAAVADQDGRVLAVARGRGTNYQGIGRAKAAAELKRLIEKAVKNSGAARIHAACYGLSGADREKDFELFRQILAPLDPAEKSVLVNDTLLALRAGTPDGVGVALIGGAGSNCIGMNRRGKIKKAWGLGPLTGDKANAFQLAFDAVVAAMKGIDGRGPKTLLEHKFKKALGLSALEDIIEFDFPDSRKRINLAELAPLVFEAADEGDEPALAILRDHGRAAGQAALAVMRGLFSPRTEVKLVLGGSVLQKGSNPALVSAIKRTVKKEFPKTRVIRLEDPPLLGGLLRALDLVRPGTGERRRHALRFALREKLEEELEDNGIK